METDNPLEALIAFGAFYNSEKRAQVWALGWNVNEILF